MILFLLSTFCVLITLCVPITTQRRTVGKLQYKKTSLVGSEFEESLVTQLLNSSSLSLLDDDITHLLANTNLSYTLVDPDKPFEFVERNYYWSQDRFNESSEDDNSTVYSVACVFNITEDPAIFSQIYFPDGSPIQEMVFGCENNKDCCGLKCCGDDVLINIIIVAAISIALVFLLLCNILIGFKKRRENRKNNASVIYEVGRTQDTIDTGDELDTNQVTIQTRHPANANYHPNHT